MGRKKQDDGSDNHAEARRLYIEDGLGIQALAERLGVSAQTVYRYKSSDMVKGDDWERQRNVWNMSPSEISNIYAYALKRLLVKVDADPDLLLNAATADAITKNIKNLQRIDPRHQYIGAVIDLVKAADQFLGERDEKLQGTMRLHWDAIKDRMVEALNKERLFS
ncbi:MAG: hypothetical protein A2Y38_09200 [Spirochaetes bacterium GWB1_59_5]|nr:MAG: hypothetical protein A2Y38_09200 [Spirochaetes bacterium GWB1_59_5]